MVCDLDNKNTCSTPGLKSFDTATSILSGVEAMDIIKKEQITLRNQSSKIKKDSSINCLDLQNKIRFR